MARFDFVEASVDTRTHSATKIQQTWLASFEALLVAGNDINSDKDHPVKVIVTDLVRVANGLLVVVGSTNGYGRAFGTERDPGRTDVDGFVVKVSPSHGQLIIEPCLLPSYRIQSSSSSSIDNSPHDLPELGHSHLQRSQRRRTLCIHCRYIRGPPSRCIGQYE